MNPSGLTAVAVIALILVACASAPKPGPSDAGVASADKESGRISVRSQSDLPAFSYPLGAPTASELLEGGPAFDALVEQVRRDTEHLLADYDIQDKATLRSLHRTLSGIATLRGDLAQMQVHDRAIRDLTDKPADKWLAMLSSDAVVAASAAGADPAARHAAFRQSLDQSLAAMPWPVVKNDVIASRAETAPRPHLRETYVESVRAYIDPGVAKSGRLDRRTASDLIDAQAGMLAMLPHMADFHAALDAYIRAHEHDPAGSNFWHERNVALDDAQGLAPVNVAIWDTGADLALFAGQLWANPNEQADGRDDDGNGFIDDVHGIAFDEDERPLPSHPLRVDFEAKYAGREAEFRDHVIGMADSIYGRDTALARKYARNDAMIDPQDRAVWNQPFSYYRMLAHGTQVSAVALADNPAARLMTVQWVTRYDQGQPEPPTLEEAQAVAALYTSVIAWLKAQGARVVNMSWKNSPENYDRDLRLSGSTLPPEERRAFAQRLFRIAETALIESIRGAPDILFVPGAGNDDNDATFSRMIPSGIELPNVLTVGAVDAAGQSTAFTTTGRNVRVYAHGDGMETLLPGGHKILADGTSLAAPQVTNLAAKLWALDPSLTVTDVVQLILDGTDRNAEGLPLLNPKRSVERLGGRNPYSPEADQAKP